MPVAVNCCTAPIGIEGFAGVTRIDTITASVTVSVVLPLIDPEVAVMVTVPAASVEAKPVLSTVATVESDEFHVTPDRVCVLPSVNEPVAVNWVLFPSANDGSAGVREIDTSAAGSTVKFVLPVTEPTVAEMVTVPAATVVAVPVPSMVATVGSEDAQVTLARVCELPSL